MSESPRILDRAYLAMLAAEGWQHTAEGWIDERGRFLPVCYYETHGEVAQTVLGEDGEAEADRRGWLRISNWGNQVARQPNQRQLDTWFDYCEAQGLDFREELASLEILD